MTWVIVRLRLTMWRTMMTRSPLHLTSSVLGGLAALGVVLTVGPGLSLLALQPLGPRSLTVPLFATVTLVWILISLVAAGVDNVVDPARFALLPLNAGELAKGLLAAACTGIPALMLLLLSLAQVIAWAGTPVAVPAALVAAVLGSLTAILGSRAVTSLLARVMTGRVGRLVGAVIISLASLLPLAFNLVVAHGAIDPELRSFDARRAASAASWTPVGWAWALPFDVATGRWGAAATHLVLALGLAVLLWWLWVRAIERTLLSPLTSAGGQRIGAGRLLPAVLGHSPVATVAARRIRAWYRDSRLVAIALRTAVLPVFFLAQSVLTGERVFAGVGVVSLGVLAGLTLMNDLAFDGPAWWLHVSTGLRGWEDRLGRALASVVVFGPVLVLTTVVAMAIGVLGSPLPWLTVILAAFFASLGLALLVGSILPGTAPRTGGNPFAASSGGAAQGCLSALVAVVGPVVLILPVIVLVIVTRGSGLGRWAALVGGVVYGLALLAAGVLLGGRRLERRAPEMLGRLRQVHA